MLIDARVCITNHPSGVTLARWLREIGFSQVLPTHSGAAAAGMLFDALPKAKRPSDLRGVDELIRPAVETAVQTAAPMESDPMITAVK